MLGHDLFRRGFALALLSMLAIFGLAAMLAVAIGGLSAKSDPPRARILETDVEELAARLREQTPYELPHGTDPERLPTEIPTLMSAYELSVQEAVDQMIAQGDASVTAAWLREVLGEDPRLGGLRIDHGLGGHLVVMTSDAGLGEAIVAATAGLVTIEVVVTSVSEDELEAIAQNVGEALDLVDSESRLGTGVPYYEVGVELRKGRVVIGQSSLAPEEYRQKVEKLALNPLVFVEDFGPVLLDHGGDG